MTPPLPNVRRKTSSIYAPPAACLRARSPNEVYIHIISFSSWIVCGQSGDRSVRPSAAPRNASQRGTRGGSARRGQQSAHRLCSGHLVTCGAWPSVVAAFHLLLVPKEACSARRQHSKIPTRPPGGDIPDPCSAPAAKSSIDPLPASGRRTAQDAAPGAQVRRRSARSFQRVRWAQRGRDSEARRLAARAALRWHGAAIATRRAESNGRRT